MSSVCQLSRKGVAGSTTGQAARAGAWPKFELRSQRRRLRRTVSSIDVQVEVVIIKQATPRALQARSVCP
jgi:hypothetical protein